MLKALGSVSSVLIMVALGYALAKRLWFDAASRALLARLVVSVALPAYMVSNLMAGYDRAGLVAMLPGLPIPFAAMLANYGIALALAAAFRLSARRRGTFAALFALSNTIFIGLPVNLLLFGPGSLPFVLLYYIANTSIFWTLGVWGIARDGARIAGAPLPPLASAGSLRRIASPPLLAFLAAVAMILAGLRLPAFVLETCRTLGSMTTPLSMLFVGTTLAALRWKGPRLDASLVLVLAGRFLVAPLVLFALARGTGLELLAKEVFIMQSAMPAMTQIPILAKSYGADEEYAALGTALTTAASLVTIPLFMGFVARIW